MAGVNVVKHHPSSPISDLQASTRRRRFQISKPPPVANFSFNFKLISTLVEMVFMMRVNQFIRHGSFSYSSFDQWNITKKKRVVLVRSNNLRFNSNNSGSGDSNNARVLGNPEKVQAILLLLGGRETSSSMPYMSLTNHHQSKRDISSTQPRLNVPHRLASLMRFREKRKERNFEKKICYTVRKEVALRMQRNKGQFTSSKPVNEDSATSWESNQGWQSDGSGSRHQETACRHCGTNEKSTPLMRSGPNGPTTLCNACGLMWATKGTLRDLSKAVASTPVGKSPSLNGSMD